MAAQSRSEITHFPNVGLCERMMFCCCFEGIYYKRNKWGPDRAEIVPISVELHESYRYEYTSQRKFPS